MAHQNRQRADVRKFDPARGADAASRRDPTQDVPGKEHPRADGPADLSEADRRLPAAKLAAALDALTEAAEAQRNATFAVLQELRRGRQYREENPPRPPAIAGTWRGYCEQCGAWYDDDDELLHHQFTAHNEIFREPGELAFEAVPCLCSSCSPGAFGAWCRDAEEAQTGPLPKAVIEKSKRR